MPGRWFNSLRVQIGLSIFAIFFILVASMGYTLYALKQRQQDYHVLDLAARLRIISLGLREQATNYLMHAPDDYDKYNRDLGTYWRDLQAQTMLYGRIVEALESRMLDDSLVGENVILDEAFNEQTRDRLNRAAIEWRRFKTGLDEKLGDNLQEPRLTWAAEYIHDRGDALAQSSGQLSVALQAMMQQRLEQIRVFQWIAGGGGLLIMALILLVMQRLVMRPLGGTLAGFDRVSRGDFSHPVPVSGFNEIRQMTEAFNRLTERLNAMFQLTDRINQGKKLDEMLRFVHDEFQGFVPLDWVGVFYMSPDGGRFALERCYSPLPTRFKDGLSFDVGHGTLSRLGESPGPVAASLPADADAANACHCLDVELSLDGMRAVVYMPLLGKGENRAVMVFATRGNGYAQEHVEFLANVAAMMSHVLEKTVVLENLVAAAVQGLAKLAESRDPETGDHLTRMALYSAQVAEELGRAGSYAAQITPEFVRDVYHFAPMHDIGKVGVRDDVLLKPGRLDADERREMERHPVIGGEVLRRAEAQVQALGHSMFKVGIEIAEGHHEKFDGGGYPQGLKGQEIPLAARIVAAADVFDALTSRRPYKEAWAVDEALSFMQEQAGGHFDPEVVAALHRALPRMMEIYDKLKHV